MKLCAWNKVYNRFRLPGFEQLCQSFLKVSTCKSQNQEVLLSFIVLYKRFHGHQGKLEGLYWIKFLKLPLRFLVHGCLHTPSLWSYCSSLQRRRIWLVYSSSAMHVLNFVNREIQFEDCHVHVSNCNNYSVYSSLCVLT